MGKEEEKPIFGHFHETNPQFYQTNPQSYQTNSQFYQTNPQFHQMQHLVYVEPCPGYPSNASTQQPYAYYDYNYPARPLPYVSPEINQGFSFGRVMLCLMLFILLFGIIVSMSTMMIFMTVKPTFNLESFEVRSFDMSGNGGPGTTLKVNCETKLSVKNSNHRSSILLNNIESTLEYRYIALDTSIVDRMEIKSESSVQIPDAFSFPSLRRSFNVDNVVSEMAKDRQRGQIMFNLKIELQLFVKSNVFHRSDKMRLFCESITLKFQNSTNIPTWNGSKDECKSGF